MPANPWIEALEAIRDARQLADETVLRELAAAKAVTVEGTVVSLTLVGRGLLAGVGAFLVPPKVTSFSRRHDLLLYGDPRTPAALAVPSRVLRDALLQCLEALPLCQTVHAELLRFIEFFSYFGTRKAQEGEQRAYANPGDLAEALHAVRDAVAIQRRVPDAFGWVATDTEQFLGSPTMQRLLALLESRRTKPDITCAAQW